MQVVKNSAVPNMVDEVANKLQYLSHLVETGILDQANIADTALELFGQYFHNRHENSGAQCFHLLERALWNVRCVVNETPKRIVDL